MIHLLYIIPITAYLLCAIGGIIGYFPMKKYRIVRVWERTERFRVEIWRCWFPVFLPNDNTFPVFNKIIECELPVEIAIAFEPS